MRHRLAETELPAVLAFLQAHSGKGHKQCRRHSPVEGMTDRAALAALYQETGLEVSRATLARLCRQAGVARRGRTGPIGAPEAERPTRSTARWRKWKERKMQDPVAFEAWKLAKSQREAAARKAARGEAVAGL